MDNSFSIRITKKRIILAVLFGTALITYINILGLNFTISEDQRRIIYAEILVSSLCALFEIKAKGRAIAVVNLVIIYILSVIMAVGLDMFNGMYTGLYETPIQNFVLRFLLSVAFCYLLYLLFIALIGRTKGACIVCTVGLFLAGLLGYAILVLRGSRLVFSDITAFDTALEIMGGYTLPVHIELYYGIISLFCTIPILWQVRKGRYLRDSLTRLVYYMIFLFGFYGIYTGGFEELHYSWIETENSYVYSFFANAKLLHINPSVSYSVEEAEGIIEEGAKQKANFLPSNYSAQKAIKKKFPEYVKKTGKTDPNIVVIMNESLTDLEVYGDIESDEEIMPNINGGLENSLFGDVFTEIYGGGTADSEYSFLTGNSTILLPSNARPYQLYVQEDSENLVRSLEGIGYETVAIHPGVPNAWNRENVYETFGFDKVYFINSFEGNEVRRAPTLFSDAATYDQVIKSYEDKGNKPVFIFDVTIQNHGGYTQGYGNLEKFEVNSDVPAEIQEFISLVHASDADFKELIDYFKKIDEPTVVMMFGDHQPKFSSDYVDEMMGVENGQYTLKQDQRKQATPYVIWANYKLPSEQIGSVSVNYLSSLLMECAGLEKTPYQKYLSALHKKLKILDRKGIITDASVYYSYGDEELPEEYQEYIDDYRDVLYYTMIDSSKNDESLFQLKSGSG